MTKIYVGNLSYETNENDLETLFNEFGDINSVKLIKDFETGRSKGFAFIEFANAAQAQAALKLDGEEFKGRRIKVNIAREKSSGSSGDRGRRRW
jgi:cold-inducible RNA-binding protein